MVLALLLLPAPHPHGSCCPEEGFPQTRGTWRGAGFPSKKLQNSWKLVASLLHTSRDSVKNMKLYFGFCSLKTYPADPGARRSGVHISTRVGAGPLRQPLLRLHLRRPGHQGHLQPGQVVAERILIGLQFLVFRFAHRLDPSIFSRRLVRKQFFFVDVFFLTIMGLL